MTSGTQKLQGVTTLTRDFLLQGGHMCRCVFQQEGWRQGAVKLNLMNFRAELRVSTS